MLEQKIDRIVELDIELDDFSEEELEEFGVAVVSIVEEPAIGENFHAFSTEEFVKPRAGESENDFISRCMSDLSSEYPDEEQRLAVCYSYYEGETHEFETYNDYPEAARNNACRALKWADENGWGDCGTPVGKARANQLCSGENLSRETIARMASFKRQQQNKDTPYGEGCGGLMWDAWGGDAGIEWAIRKLKQIDEEMSKNKDIYLISCSSEKVDKKSPASELYCSPLFAKSLEYARKQVSDDQIFILSAKYGLVPLSMEIDPYDITLKDMPSEDRKTWAENVYLELEKRFNIKKDRFIFLAGTAYTEYLIPKFQYSHDFLEGKKIGERLEYLNQFYICFNSATHEFEFHKQQYTFSTDDEKRIITGPLIIPNKMILRRNADGSPYYVFFSKATIRKMAEKFLRLNKHNNTDVNHDWQITTNNTLIESWISESPKYDKAYHHGFALPAGTWYVSYKINDDETWESIKSGKLKGFSLAGPFIERLATEKIHNQTLSKIIEILKQIDEA